MRILLDECLPKDLARELPGHDVTTVPQAGWASISNGKLLRRTAASGKFDMLLTMDKRLPSKTKPRRCLLPSWCCGPSPTGWPMSSPLRRKSCAASPNSSPARSTS